MISVKFNLKEPNSYSSLIMMIFHFGYYELDGEGNRIYKFLKVSTGQKVQVKYWDAKRQEVKQSRSYPEHREINIRLDKLESTIKDVYRRMLNNGDEINLIKLKQQYLDELSAMDDMHRPNLENSLIPYIERIIKKAKADRASATIAIYKSTLMHLRRYSEQRRINLDFNKITLDFYYDFLDYFNSKGFSNNTKGKYIKTLITFLRTAEEDSSIDVKIPPDYKSKRFRVLKEEVDNVYLNSDELSRFTICELSSNPRLDKVRDLFIIGCYTALRFSDFTEIKRENFYTDDNHTYLKIKTKKTGTLVTIPVHPEVLRIMEKYNWNLPKPISNQKFNDYIREIGLIAQIDTPCEIVKSKGSLHIKDSLPKYKLITSHTARRTGATNMYRHGVDILLIMQITGHTSIETLLKYIKATSEEKARKSAENPFFHENPNMRVAE